MTQRRISHFLAKHLIENAVSLDTDLETLSQTEAVEQSKLGTMSYAHKRWNENLSSPTPDSRLPTPDFLDR